MATEIAKTIAEVLKDRLVIWICSNELALNLSNWR